MNSFIYNTFALLSILFLFNACTKVIDIELEEGKERLVVDASIQWEKGTIGKEQSISLSTSLGYFDNGMTPVTGAEVNILNSNTGDTYLFQDQNNGTYSTDSFVPILNASYTLNINYNDETYSATEILKSVPAIKSITRIVEKRRRISILFDDVANEENYYLRNVESETQQNPDFETISDENKDGNELETIYRFEAEEKSTTIQVSLLGISQRYFEYMKLIIDQSQGNPNPFDVTPSEVRGNCINLDITDNYALGYFSLSEVVKEDYFIF